MPLFWYLAGVLSTIAALALLSPWLKLATRFAGFTATPSRAVTSAAILVAMIFGLFEWIGRPGSAVLPSPMSQAAGAAANAPANSFGAAAKIFGSATGADLPRGGATGPGAPAPTANAGSMDSAIANLEARLAKGGGTPGDWELLAKSFEFLGRPADAAKARAHQLPSLGAQPDSAPAGGPPGTAPAAGGSSAAVVSGTVTLDAALRGKAAAGDTLFIIAKSVDSPGAPVAVIRSSVGAWPLAFSLDDAQSMMPGRTLSKAGRVTIEARISKKGQPLPSAGDLQGSSGPIDPVGHKPLQITIDHVIT